MPMWAMPIARTTKVHAVFLAGRWLPTTRHKDPPVGVVIEEGDDQASRRGDGICDEEEKLAARRQRPLFGLFAAI